LSSVSPVKYCPS